MSKKVALVAGAVAAAVAAGVPAWAHHSFAATYQMNQTQTIEGEVVQFLFRNPHSFVHVMGKGPDGQVHRYAVEWGAASALARGGASARSLKAGDKVIITGRPGRNPQDHRMSMQKVVRPSDGWQWEGIFD